MENAVDALKMAFAVLVFVMALSLAIAMFSQLNSVSKLVLASSDQTLYYDYKISTDEVREVGLETIIPTLYKYYKENYTVIFLNTNGKPLELYKSQTDIGLWGQSGIIGKYYNTTEEEDSNYDKNPVCSFDVDEETLRHEPWTGSPEDFKTNLDKFLNGEIFYYPSGATDNDGNRLSYNYSENPKSGNKGFIGEYAGSQFKEYLGEYYYDVNASEDEDKDKDKEILNSDLQKNRKKRVIIYKLQD